MESSKLEALDLPFLTHKCRVDSSENPHGTVYFFVIVFFFFIPFGLVTAVEKTKLKREEWTEGETSLELSLACYCLGSDGTRI